MYHPETKVLITPQEQAIVFAKEAGIEEVVPIFTSEGTFFGVPKYSEDPEILDDEGLVTSWNEYGPVCTDEDLRRDMVKAGINVLFYDLDGLKFLGYIL